MKKLFYKHKIRIIMDAKSKMIFLIVGIILNINFGYAQKSREGFSCGIKSGINMSSLVSEESLFERNENAISKKFGYVGGIFVEYKFTKCFYLRVIYSILEKDLMLNFRL